MKWTILLIAVAYCFVAVEILRDIKRNKGNETNH